MPDSRFLSNARLWVMLIMAILALAVFSSTVVAQTATGGIRGVVTDSSGAALPSANVTAVNTSTGTDLKTTTTGDGLYSFPRILPGKYIVRIEVKNFKRAEITDVDVNAGRDSVIDVKLEPGQISEVVTVQGANEAVIEKDTVQISTTLSL